MQNKLGLTETQYMIMCYFWEKDCELTTGMVQAHFAENGYPWAIQTVQTFLEALVKKGALAIKRQGHHKKYYPPMPRLAYASIWLGQMITQNFDNGVEDFLTALAGFRNNMTKDQKEKLNKIWNE